MSAATDNAIVRRRQRNPLRILTIEELESNAQSFYARQNLQKVVNREVFLKGARIAWNTFNIDGIPGLTEAEISAIREERSSGFLEQTKDLKVTILTTACAAIIQGWQQSSINASSHAWQGEFSIGNQKILAGLIDGAPWLSGSIIGAWLSDPLQEGRYGRRPALFLSAIFCTACVIGSARCNEWVELLICRLLLGIGIGAKASIAPVFAAEAAADHLRGRLLMMWQLCDTFGIFIGFVCVWIVDRNWRIILATPAIPALILLFLVFLCPESPRYLIRKGEYGEAFLSLRHLRGTDIQASRDLYYIHGQLQAETELRLRGELKEWYKREIYQEEISETSFIRRVIALWTIKRNRRACLAAFLVMASQQLCGINVLSFYSSAVFEDVFKVVDPLHDPRVTWLNFGFGLSNFLFTIPAYRFIDGRGRRLLLLISLGGMFFTLLAISFFFRIHPDTVRTGLVSSFTICIFLAFYGIGAGPVPFTFSAEVFPLAFREVGMSFSVMVNFLGLAILVIFVPVLTEVWKPNGSSNLLFLFTGLNVLAFVLVFLLVPSGTAQVSLEDMDHIFNQQTSTQARKHLSELGGPCGRLADEEDSFEL